MTSLFVAAIQQSPGQPAENPAELIYDIVPPVPVPMPAWQWALIGLGALAIAGLAVWLFLRWYRNRPGTPPETPRMAALRDLEALRAQVRILDPYQFSIAVSDVLRGFVGRQFGLRAKEQTSPEFLAAIGHAPGFSADDRQLLARFLERCDLIKFARVEADERVSEELLESALAFVRGGRV